MRAGRHVAVGLVLAATISAARAEDLVVAAGPPASTIIAPDPATEPRLLPPLRSDGDVRVATPLVLAPRAPPRRAPRVVKRHLAKLTLLAVAPQASPTKRITRPLVKARLPLLALLPRDPRGAAPPPQRTLTITVAGDLGFGGHMQPVRREGAVKQGSTISWRDYTDRVRPLIDGDLNFANLETVLTERNDLRAEAKTFNFRSHPEGMRHIAGLGLNLISTANNHAMDFGAPGALDTISHLDRLLAAGGIKAHAGLGRNREEASRAQIVDVGEAKVAFSALGIVSGGFPLHRASDNRPGQMAYQSLEDFGEVTRRLADAQAAYRILSVHHGIERQVATDGATIRKLRHEAVLARGVDLVIGHHAHVVQGIEIVDGRVIFYGLGNFLHPGMQNMAGNGLCRDYGLFARLHLATDETGHFRVRAIEAIPLTDMHYKAGRMAPQPAAERVHVLNYLATGLDDNATGARGVRFAAQTDGSGLYCTEGADRVAGRIGNLCRNWRGPDVLNAAQRSRVVSACGYIGAPSPPPLVARAPVAPRAEPVSARRSRPQPFQAAPVMAGN